MLHFVQQFWIRDEILSKMLYYGQDFPVNDSSHPEIQKCTG